MSQTLPAHRARTDIEAVGTTQQYVTMTIADQLFGIPVLTVQDVLGPQKITRVPLSPPEVAGSLNLRGRVVTAVNMRRRLSLPPQADESDNMSIVVEHGGELYSLIIDEVGEVLSLNNSIFERNPGTLDPRWREIAAGVYRLDKELMVVLDVNRVLDISNIAA
ncbi:chemotaxis protein CheW [Alphaproteobacteria bacterium HT1-32]|nr:chemotaxis protein CheW [Alphaproteobacteria bacterium HT1-32]|tara:strand:+ start:103235 stop:103723 length:489 start_codon:yes stop_codon:yes gene_type:complete